MFYKNSNPFTLCEYSAKNTTKLTTSTQKTPITTTLSTSKTNNTRIPSKPTTKSPVKSTTPLQIENETTKLPPEATTTEEIEGLTTQIPTTQVPSTATRKVTRKPSVRPTTQGSAVTEGTTVTDGSAETTTQEGITATTRKFGRKPTVTTTEGMEELTTLLPTTRKYTGTTKKTPTGTTTEGMDEITTLQMTTTRSTGFRTRTKSPTRTTTVEGSGETTTLNPLGKYPRLGDNNITDSGAGKPIRTTTSADELVTLISTITDSSRNDETTIPTEFMENTTAPLDTKRTRVDTTLEVETTTNQIVTVTEGKSGRNDTHVVSVSQTTRKSCKANKDCATTEVCIKKECTRVCETNKNVTKTSDDCVKGTCAT